MNDVVIIINHDGTFDKVLSDNEINVKVLKRGRDDTAIDHAETHLEEITE